MVLRTAVIVHVFHREFWGELADCIRNITAPADLFVTFVDPLTVQAARRDFPDATFVQCENRGFDVGPFFRILSQIDLSCYDLVVKLHTKRDVANLHSDLEINRTRLGGSAWRCHLLAFCATPANWRQTLSRFRKSRVGMVADRHIMLKREDVPWAEETYDCFDEAVAKVRAVPGCRAFAPSACRYAAGTMFVVRREVCEFLLRAGLADAIYEPTAHAERNHQLAHVVERMFGVAVAGCGMAFVPWKGSLLGRRMRYAVKDFLFRRTKTDRWHTVKILGMKVFRRRMSGSGEKEERS